MTEFILAEAFMLAIQHHGLSEQIRDADVVEEWDITDLPVGKAIIGIFSGEPFQFQFKKNIKE